MAVWNFVRRSFYQDSVTLMRLTRDMEAVAGVRRAAAMMGTPQNLALLKDAGLLGDDGGTAAATDLVIAVVADSAAAAQAARATVETALTARRATPPGTASVRPRTLDSALRALPDATIALISVPGPYAGAEALKALRAGLHVMLFSDNVPVETEIELKRLARAKRLFLMGPDCGTAIIGGVPLGFANAVPRGRIGLAAASGTGLQEVACHIAAGGEGVSHAIGVGGRDLSDAVGGAMMEQALEALAEDPATAVVGMIGKPPGARTLARLRALIPRLGKPCVVHFMGATSAPGDVWHAAATLEDAGRATVALARGERPLPIEFSLPPGEIEQIVAEAIRGMAPPQRLVRGVFAGGTLAWEAIGLLSARLAGVAASVTGGGDRHRVVDLGEDVFTVGRPHPMIDGTVRREWIATVARDPTTAVVLLDLVLGHGAHADPAGELAAAITAARRGAEADGRRLAIVASVCGTEADPQRRSVQTATLTAAGVLVMPSNAQAARLAAVIATRRGAG